MGEVCDQGPSQRPAVQAPGSPPQTGAVWTFTAIAERASDVSSTELSRLVIAFDGKTSRVTRQATSPTSWRGPRSTGACQGFVDDTTAPYGAIGSCARPTGGARRLRALPAG